MKKTLKVLSALALAGVATAAVTSCGKDSKQVKIFIGFQQQGDPTTIATENILNALKDELNFTYDSAVLNSRDSVANLNTFNEKLTMGYDAIISMADLDVEQAESLIDTCAEVGAYYVGYKLDMANAMKSEKVKNSEYFLGGTSDGELDWGLRAEKLFDALKASDDRKIVLASFSSQYFPQVTDALTRFKELVTEWNAANPDDQFTYGTWTDGSDTWTCKFSALPDAEKQKITADGVDAIIATNSVAKYVLPGLDSSVHLYNVGYDQTYDDQFGEDKQLRCQGQSPADHIILPLIRVINAVNGADPIPVEDKVVVGNYIYMTKAQDLVDLKATSINFTTDHSFEDALFTVEDAKALVGAADSKLVQLCESWTTEYVLNRK